MKSHEHTLVHVHKHNARSHSEHDRSVWRVLRRPRGIGWVAFGSALLLLTSMGPSCGAPSGGPLLPDTNDEQVLDYQPGTSTSDPSGPSSPTEPSTDTTATWPQLTIQASAVEGVAPLDAVFTAATLDGTALPSGNYAWDFGDGAVGSGQQVAHTYTRAAVYTVTLVLTVGAMDTPDSAPLDAPQSVTATTTVAVSEPPPSEPDSQPLGISAEYEVIEGAPFQFVLSANSADGNTRFTVTALPTNGAVNVPSGTGLDSPVLTYTPGTDFVGEDTLAFVAYDSAHTTPQTVLGIPYAIIKFRVRHKATLVTSPDSGLMATGNQGGPFSPDSITYTLLNTGEQTLSWSATNTQNWVTVSKTSGALAVGATDTVTVSINYLAHSLAAGSYDDTIAFKNETNNVGSTNRPVHLTVNELPGVLAVSPSTGLAAVGNPGGPFAPASVTYTLSNSGGATLAWTAVKGQNWVTVSKPSGELAGGATDTVVVSINANANSLSAGGYADTVTFTNTTHDLGGTTRPISLAVGGIPISGTITRVIAGGGTSPVSGLSLTFTGSGASSGQNFTVATAASGTYSVLVPIGWSGAAAATDIAHWCLCPLSRDYTDIQANQTAQDFSAGRNYYVATTGADSAAGTLAAPFATIQKAAATLLPGDVCMVRGGLYYEQVQHSRDGFAGYPIAYRAYPAEVPILDGGNTRTNGFYINNANFITIDGFEVRNFTGRGIYLEDVSDHCVVSNCTVHDCLGVGVLLRGGDDCIIESNEIYRCYIGIRLQWRDTNQNIVERATVRHNIVHDNTRELEESDNIAGSACRDSVFEYNLCWNGGDDGIDISASSGGTDYPDSCVLRYNVAWNSGFLGQPGDGNGIKISTNAGGGFLVHHNICFRNWRAGFDQDLEAGWEHNSFYNNVAYANTRGGFVIEGSQTGQGRAIAKNNVGWGNDPGFLNGWGDLFTHHYGMLESDFNNWGIAVYQTPDPGYEEGPHSHSSNPWFQDPDRAIDTGQEGSGHIPIRWAFIWNQVVANFSLNSGSPLIDGGIAVPGVTDGFMGAAPDLGAIER